MSDFNPNSTQLQTQLAKKYFELSPAIQKIIQLFSVIYAPIDKNSFLSCLSQTAALDEKNRPWTTTTLNYQIEKLVIALLLVKENKLGPECNPLLTEIATRHAVETGKFEITERFAIARILSSLADNGNRRTSIPTQTQ